MKSLIKSKKGISPILATLLLIVIAVAAVIVTYAWVMTFTESTAGQAGAVLQRENIRYFGTGANKQVEITVRNSGTASAQVAEVYNGTSTSNLQIVPVTVTYNPTSQIIAEGDSITITFNLDWEIGTRYYFKVVTEEGFNLPLDAEVV